MSLNYALLVYSTTDTIVIPRTAPLFEHFSLGMEIDRALRLNWHLRTRFWSGSLSPDRSVQRWLVRIADSRQYATITDNWYVFLYLIFLLVAWFTIRYTLRSSGYSAGRLQAMVRHVYEAITEQHSLKIFLVSMWSVSHMFETMMHWLYWFRDRYSRIFMSYDYGRQFNGWNGRMNEQKWNMYSYLLKKYIYILFIYLLVRK
jgi:hypothetical protein